MTKTNDNADPDKLRQDIQQTQTELSETVQALAAKTDVRARAEDRTSQLRSQLQQRLSEVRTSARRNVTNAPTILGKKTSQGTRAARQKALHTSQRIRRKTPQAIITIRRTIVDRSKAAGSPGETPAATVMRTAANAGTRLRRNPAGPFAVALVLTAVVAAARRWRSRAACRNGRRTRR
jgi:hypothetical protein